MYTKKTPNRVKATRVSAATLDRRYVHVEVQSERFRMCEVRWNDPVLDKSRPDVLVCNSQGDWLCVWFFDEEVEEFLSVDF